MATEGEASLRVLLLEGNAADANLLRATLDAESDLGFDVEWVDQLRPGLDRLAKGDIDVALINLSLPDSTGMDTFRAVRQEAPDIPLLILACYEDQDVASTALREGAHDYLLKNELWPGTLARALRQAVTRQEQVADLRLLALVDELTGLHNRRGFLGLGDQLIKVADRNAMGVSLVYCDVDGLKAINDKHGHRRGDDALVAVAEALRRTFRTSDVVARVGGDEFCALLVADGSGGDIPLGRLLTQRTIIADGGGPVSLAVGVAYRGPGSDMSLEELMERADAAMYANKFSAEGRPKSGTTTDEKKP